MGRCANCGEVNPDTARFCQSCGTALEEAAPTGAPAAQERRKTVSVVFCDLVGSTALGERLDPESVRSIVTRYFGEMNELLERYGGTVEKFIGDAVVGVFGIPIVHEDDAMRAVTAAVEMRQKAEEIGADLELQWGTGLKVRIGVNTGEVLAGDPTQGHGFATGDAMNVAARLEQVAAPGEILIGESTYRLVRDGATTEPVEPLELKGKEDPVAAYRVTAIKPRFRGVSRRFDSPLVGRDEELDRLQEVFTRVVEQRDCELATVFGAAGSGKSRITVEFIASLGDVATIARGRCLSYGDGITFWPLAEAIKELAEIDEGEAQEAARDKITGLLSEHEEAALIAQRLFPALGFSDRVVTTEESFWAIRKLFETVAQKRPLVLVIEDLHWAEATMLDLIEYLVSFGSGASIMLVCLARRELLDVRPTWGMDSTSITLEPLGGQEEERLLDNLFGQSDISPEVQRRILESAEGNPLYIEEIVRMLLDAGLLVPENGSLRAVGELTTFPIPPTITAVIAARLDRLADEERTLIQNASIVGATFWWGAVSNLLPAEQGPRIARHLQSLVRKEFFQPHTSSFPGEDAFRFGHVLVRDSAYQTIPKSIRAELHERLVPWIESKVADRLLEYEEILGYHLEQAFHLKRELGMPSTEIEQLGIRAAERLGSAGSRALARSDMSTAAHLLERASALLPLRDERRLELLLDLSDALLETAEFDKAGEVIDQLARIASDVGNEVLSARASLQRCRLDSFQEPTSLTEAERLVAAFEQLDDHTGRARAHILVAEVHWENHNYARAEDALQQALDFAQKAGGRHDEALILSFLSAAPFWGPTPVDEAIARLEEILALRSDHPLVRANCLMQIGALTAMKGEFDEARSLMNQAKGLYQELGYRTRLAGLTQESGLIELMASDPEAAEKELRVGYEAFREMGEQQYLVTSAALLAHALLLQNRHDEAEEFARVAQEAAENEEMLTPEWAPTSALLLAIGGRLEEAEELARTSVRIAEGTDDVLARGESFLALGEILKMKGEKNEALELGQRAKAEFEGKGIVGFVARAQALLDELATA